MKIMKDMKKVSPGDMTASADLKKMNNEILNYFLDR